MRKCQKINSWWTLLWTSEFGSRTSDSYVDPFSKKKNKKKQWNYSITLLLLITGRKIGHRRKERECVFPCSEATSDDLVLLFHWRSCYLVAVLFSTRFHLPSLSFFFFLACSVTNILTPSSFKQARMKMLEKRWNVDPDHSVLFG